MYRPTNNVKNRIEESAIDPIPIDVSATDHVLDTPARGFVIGTAGDLDVTTVVGNRRVLPNLPVGQFSIAVIAVHNAETTASDITLLI